MNRGEEIELLQKVITKEDTIENLYVKFTWLRSNNLPYITHYIPDSNFVSVAKLLKYIEDKELKHLSYVDEDIVDGYIQDFKQLIKEIKIEYEYNRPFTSGYSFDTFIKYAKENNLEWYENANSTDLDKIYVLATHLNLYLSELKDIEIDDTYSITYYYYAKEEYCILKDDEADELEEETVRNTINDCYLYDLIKGNKDHPALNYIDIDRWVEDWCGNRGENLNPYDGTEYDYKVNDTWYYVYRQN